MQNQQQPSMFGPALIAGGVFGFLSGIPFINYLNCLCCALVIACGFVAAYLYSKPCKDAGIPFRAGNGALVGLISGGIHAVVATVVGSVIGFAFGMFDPSSIAEQAAGNPMADPESIDQFVRMMESTGPIVIVLVLLLVQLIAGAIFATIGGAIGGAVFKQEPPAAPPAMTPPPPASEPPPPPVGPST